MRSNRIVITGGMGFIGSHLVDLVVKELGAIPEVIDDGSRGIYVHPKAISSRWVTYRRVNLINAEPDFSTADTIFHLAARVTGIQYNTTHQFDMLQSNLAINSSVANSIFRARKSIRRIMWVSTACVYPHDAPVPTPEDGTANVCNPEPTNRGYGIAKWVGEQQALYLLREFNVPITIVRFFNAFGPRDYYDPETSHVAPALIKRVMDGNDPLVIWGTGTQTRSLVDARDLARVLMDLADCPESIGQIVNIGHSDEISMLSLANLIMCRAYEGGYINHNPTVITDRSKPNGYERRAADTSKLMSLIGRVPNTPIQKTIDDMLKDYNERRCKRCNHHPCVCTESREPEMAESMPEKL